MSYYVDPRATWAEVPCTIVPSVAAPGKTLLCREADGACMVVEPDGSQTRWELPSDPAFDSPYTWGTVLSGFLVFRSATGPNPGTPRSYRMIG